MSKKRKLFVIPSFCLLATFLISIPALAIIQNYPDDYTQCYMQYHDYQPDWFCNASDTPISQAYRDAQTTYARKIFRIAYNSPSATPRYSNMWGTYSTSMNGAHEGLDMIYGSTGQPVYHWGAKGVVTIRNENEGLLGIYDQTIQETIFYRHMDTVKSCNVGDTIYHGTQIGTQGAKGGHCTGTHLHCGVEWGNTSSDSPEYNDNNFSSQNIYYAMQLLGY